MSSEKEIVGQLLEALSKDDGQLKKMGVKIGHLYTDIGLPIDMAMDRLDLKKHQRVAVLNGVCEWLIEHKRNSGGTEKSINRQKKSNRAMIARFIQTGEVGAY